MNKSDRSKEQSRRMKMYWKHKKALAARRDAITVPTYTPAMKIGGGGGAVARPALREIEEALADADRALGDPQFKRQEIEVGGGGGSSSVLPVTSEPLRLLKSALVLHAQSLLTDKQFIDIADCVLRRK